MAKLPLGPRINLIQTARYARDPYGYMIAMQRKYGDPFTVPTLNGVLVLTGEPASVQQIFSAVPRHLPAPRHAAMMRMSLIASLWLFLGYVLQTVGLHLTTASNSAFITVLYVVFVPLFLRRLTAHTWISNGIAVFGLWLLVKPTASANLGDLLTLGSAAAFAAHMVCLERYTRTTDAVSLFVWQLVMMTVAMLGAMWWEQPALAMFEPSRVLLLGLGVTGILATGAFAVQMWAQQLLPAQQVALLFAVEPAIAAWLAWYFLGENLDAQGWFGSAMILGGVLLGSRVAGEIRQASPESVAQLTRRRVRPSGPRLDAASSVSPSGSLIRRPRHAVASKDVDAGAALRCGRLLPENGGYIGTRAMRVKRASRSHS